MKSVSPSKRKVDIEPGTLFAIPLLDSGKWGVSVITWADGLGAIQVALFDRFFNIAPDEAEADSLGRSDVFLVLSAGDLGIHEGRWTRIGKVSNFEEHDWAFYTFRHDFPDAPRETAVYKCSSPGPGKIETKFTMDISEARKFPHYGVAGYGAVEKVMLTYSENPDGRLFVGMSQRPYSNGHMPS